MKSGKVVYIHRKATDGTIFYVGIGKKDRAKQKEGRSEYWKRTVNKHDYTIHIIEEGLTWEEACESEIALIDLIGRMDLGLGTLVNLTDGGDGVNGHISTKRVSLIDLNTGMTFESMRQATRHFKCDRNGVYRHLTHSLSNSDSPFVQAGAGGLRRLNDECFIEYVDNLDGTMSIESKLIKYLSESNRFKDVGCDSINDDSVENNEEVGLLIDRMNNVIDSCHWFDKQVFYFYNESQKSMAKLSEDLSISKSTIDQAIQRVKRAIREELREDYLIYRGKTTTKKNIQFLKLY